MCGRRDCLNAQEVRVAFYADFSLVRLLLPHSGTSPVFVDELDPSICNWLIPKQFLTSFSKNNNFSVYDINLQLRAILAVAPNARFHVR